MPRVFLPEGKQRKLCLSAKHQLGSTWLILANYLHVSPRSLENWYLEKRLLPDTVYINLSSLTGITFTNVKYLPDNWGRAKGGKRSLQLRKKPLWALEGSKKGGTNSAKKFPIPEYSVKLAEFIGIMLGDGGVSSGQISITLGYSTDKDYIHYVIDLISILFNAKASIFYPSDKDAAKIRVSGVNLVKVLKQLGLVEGNKIVQQIDIPQWIFKEESYMRACIRGLVDTDGCVHRKVRRKSELIEYRSVGVTFCSASIPLQKSVINIFKLLNFRVSISGRTIYLCGKEQVTRYVKEIGFSNPKHHNRYKKFLREYGWKKVVKQNCLIISSEV